MEADRLRGVAWSCAASAPGAVDAPAGLDAAGLTWISAPVPGTVAGAHRDAGLPVPQDIESVDWWYRGHASGAAGAATLIADGLATAATVWVNGEPVIDSTSMFRRHEAPVVLTGDDEIVVRFAALTPLVAQKRPRPRWRTTLLPQQGLRWWRTSLWGRLPVLHGAQTIVGPWRGLRIVGTGPRVLRRTIDVRPDGGGALVGVRIALAGASAASTVVLRSGDHAATLAVDADGVASGTLALPGLARWWPHTHGAQPLAPLALDVDGTTLDLGRIGLRTVEADTRDDGFALRVNGEPVFCRGGCWIPLDAVGLAEDPAAVRAALAQMRDGGMNMVRVTGTGVYETAAFWDACDELGLLVWQDLMIANVDPPEDPDFIAELDAEVDDLLDAVQGRPSVAVLCGGSEIEQQAAMLGLPEERRTLPVLTEHVPARVGAALPGVPWLSSSPTGGSRPFRPDVGIAHWFGVGAYLLPLAAVESAGVRFASECLALSNPPEPVTVDEVFGGAPVAGHHPAWKAAIPRDAGASWDFEDVRDHYVREIFDVDPTTERWRDPDRALDLGRAAVALAMEHVFTAWRDPASGCAGGIVLTQRDLVAGAGWGLVDVFGRPKAPWYALRQVLAPFALLIRDHGLAGLRAVVVNDTDSDWSGTLEVNAWSRAAVPTESGAGDVHVPARGSLTVDLEDVVGGFRDLGYAYKFGAPVHDVVAVVLRDAAGTAVRTRVHLPLGARRPAEPDLGLRGEVTLTDGGPVVDISTERLAQLVRIEAPGWIAEDSYLTLPPGGQARVRLRPDPHAPGDLPVRGELRALNLDGRAVLKQAGGAAS
ncbi:MAG TPA: hypothetical protein VHE83_14110 [Mycobacteriales bacterium]|nr:hypothetical protein [Mycobacteriales bacterium]